MTNSWKQSWNRGHSATSRGVWVRLTGVDHVVQTISIPAKTSYTISYNANGGTGSVVSQTKWYNEPLTLRANGFTKTGHSFAHWNTTSTNSGTTYNASAFYSANQGVTLHAIWTPYTYTINYNANGGSNAPANQTKTYGQNLTLSNGSGMTRTDFKCIGWGTSSSASSASYNLSGSYTTNAAATLYAIWKKIYAEPTLKVKSCYRADGSGNFSDSGTNLKIDIDWSFFDTKGADSSLASNGINLTIAYKKNTANQWVSSTFTYDKTSTGVSIDDNNIVKGTYINTLGNGQLDSDSKYDIKVTLEDVIKGQTQNSDNSRGQRVVIMDIPTAFFPIDITQGGLGMALGGAAPSSGLDIYYNVNFYGNTSLFSTFDKSENMDTISQNGVYYIANAVPNKPNSVGGMLLLNKGNTNTGSGLYVPNDDSSSLYKISIVNGVWHYNTISGGYLTQVTDCNNATDPNVTYYTNGDSSNLNRPINGWSVVKNLFLNGDPASGNDFGLCQIGMSMNTSAPPGIYGRTKAKNESWSSWYPFSKTLWKSVNETRSTATGNTTVTLTTTFPAKSGFTRQLMGFATNSSNVIVAGGYYDNNSGVVNLRVHNFGSTTLNVAYHVIYVYFDDSCIW